jgi:hypothetical protein
MPKDGWYPDPTDTLQQRYWDGAAWTVQARPLPAPADGPRPPVTHEFASTAPDPARGAARKGAVRRSLMTSAESFWYVLQCIFFGAGYLFKIPSKKALSEVTGEPMTGACHFWYLMQCVFFGLGYLAKVPAKKALSDAGVADMTSAESVWYIVQCVAFGGGYLAKLHVAKALSDADLTRMTGAENFWYVLGCIPFGAMYFAKIPVKKALSELRQPPGGR